MGHSTPTRVRERADKERADMEEGGERRNGGQRENKIKTVKEIKRERQTERKEGERRRKRNMNNTGSARDRWLVPTIQKEKYAEGM